MSPTAPVPAGDHAILCKGLLAAKQQEGCQGCRATSGLQPLPDSRGLGVGKLGSEGCEVTAPLIRSGEKNQCSLGLLAKCGCLEQEQHTWQHTHGFILHPFAILGASACCRLPGAAGCSACPAVAGGGQGEDGCGAGWGEAGMTFPSLGRAVVMAVLSQAWSTGGASAFS